MLGFGIGIVFCNNGSTGGTDIIAWIINKYKDVTLGRMMMYCDIVIISSCYFIFHDWKRVLFGFCVLFIMSIVIDYVINSTRQSVQFLIFSRKYEQIAEGISTKIDRGVTLLDGQGWYSKQDIKVIVVLARKGESLDIFRLVKDIDPDAFISRELFEEYKSKYPYPKKGDILISASGSIGRTVEFAGNNEYFQDSNIVWLSHDERLSNSFLKCFYSVVKWAGIEGSTIKRLYNDNILNTVICMPSVPEQEHIGLFFENLDNLITLHQRELEKLKNLKKACLEKMFV